MSRRDLVRGVCLTGAIAMPFLYLEYPTLGVFVVAVVAAGCFGWATLSNRHGLLGLALFTAACTVLVTNWTGWHFANDADLAGVLFPVVALVGWFGYYLGSIARSYVTQG